MRKADGRDRSAGGGVARGSLRLRRRYCPRSPMRRVVPRGVVVAQRLDGARRIWGNCGANSRLRLMVIGPVGRKGGAAGGFRQRGVIGHGQILRGARVGGAVMAEDWRRTYLSFPGAPRLQRRNRIRPPQRSASVGGIERRFATDNHRRKLLHPGRGRRMRAYAEDDGSLLERLEAAVSLRVQPPPEALCYG